MEEKVFEVLSVAALRKKYSLFVENRSELRLDPDRVPVALHPLIPYAELWGIPDDIIRQDLVDRMSVEEIENLRRVLDRYSEELDEWLAGSEADDPEPSDEYVAFSAMRMVADT